MAEDWLPAPPPPQVEKKASTARTILIWIALVAGFVWLYTMFSEPSGPVLERSGYSGWWIALAFVAGLAVMLGLMVWQYGASKRLNRAQWEINRELAHGRFARAAELAQAIADRAGGRLQVRALALFQRGIALVAGGDAAGAVGALLGAERTGIALAGMLRQRIAVELARAFAIGGDVAKAERWLDEAHRRAVVDHDPLEVVARTALVEAEVRARQGRFGDALAALDRDPVALDHAMPLRALQEAWLMRAFALASTSGPRDGAAPEPWLRLLRGSARPGAFAPLAQHWPELTAFLAAHELGEARAA